MKTVVLKFLYIVGMGHHGPKEMELETKLICKAEPTNVYDSNAVALKRYGTNTTVAYLVRDHARMLSSVMRRLPENTFFAAKVKSVSEVRSRRRGPQQNISVAFKCEDNMVDFLNQTFKFSGISVTFK